MDNVESRAKRIKLDKHGRSAALQRLKELKEKGVKNKYEVKELENVYDTVDESEYSKKVLERQDEDWIVDDDGSGYVEDGREIFDDDLDAESIEAAKKNKGKTKRGISRNSATPSAKGSISNMFANMSTKRKIEKEVNISEDDLLTELLTEIKSTESYSLPKTPKVAKHTKISEDVIKPLATKITRVSEPVAKKQLIEKDKNAMSNKFIVETTTHKSLPENNLDIPEETEEPMEIEEISSFENEKKESSNSNPESNDYIMKEDMLTDLLEDDNGLLSTVDVTETFQKENKQPEKLEIKNSVSAEEIFAAWESVELKHNQAKINETEKEDLNINMNNLDTENILTEIEDGEKIFRFYWWDAFELPSKPGCVFLFGKVPVKNTKNYISCCVVIKNIERKLFVLPRKYKYDLKNQVQTDEEVSMLDVYNEFKAKFTKGSEFRSRPITKSYCFMVEGVPPTTEYLEVRYPAEQGRIAKEDMQGETIQHIFGTDANFLELFLLERKIKGPSWLDIKNPIIEENKISWCKVEIHCENMRYVSETKDNQSMLAPPLTVAAINLRTALNKSMQNEIVMISCLIQSNYALDKTAPDPTFSDHFCVVTRPSGFSWHYDHNELFKKQLPTKLQKCDSERALLNYFLAMFLKIDPDLIVGHDLIGYQLDTLLQRLNFLKIGNWSRFGKLRIKTMPTRVKNIQQDLCPGRLVCDLKISAKELIKARSFDLNTLCMIVLKLEDNKRIEIENDQIKNLYEESQGLRKLIACTMQDTSYILKMLYELNVMPLAVQITNIAGYILSKTLLGGRSERNEYLLLHAFTEKNYIVPDKYGNRETKNDMEENAVVAESSRRKPQYAGGLVLDPKVGFYNTYILLMDFNSLYPSIIQEYNICFTTMKTKINEIGQEVKIISSDKDEVGILPTEIRKLVQSRREVKKLMKDVDSSRDTYMQYNIKQLALKLTANSMYGCLGFSKSRFYAQPLAARITELGREILLKTKDLVQNLCYEVIYGDTDSLMINTNIKNYNEVMKIGFKIKQEVNKYYKQIELDIDGIFKYLLLLKKKKYAALVITKDKNGKERTTQEIKGLDIVRRDWCQLASKTGKYVLDNLLCEQDEDERVNKILGHLSEIKQKLESNKIVESDLMITKQLTKDPTAYTDRKSLPHVQVAMRYNVKMGGKRLRQGDVVPYVICDDGTDKPPMQRGYHVEEFRNLENLKVDIKYYLSQQIYPLVCRLCEPLEFIHAEQIAKCLGLDEITFKKISKPTDVEHTENILSTANRFIGAEPFKFKCVNCATINEISEPVRIKSEFDIKPFLESCTNAECTVEPLDYIKSIQNQLVLSIRRFITKYYESKLICEDPACDYTTSIVPKNLIRQQYPLCTCQNGSLYREYNEKDLYKQLTYFLHIFDIAKIKKKPLLTSAMQSAYDSLKNTVDKYLSYSGFAVIDLGKLFLSLNMKVMIPQEEEENEEEE